MKKIIVLGIALLLMLGSVFAASDSIRLQGKLTQDNVISYKDTKINRATGNADFRAVPYLGELRINTALSALLYTDAGTTRHTVVVKTHGSQSKITNVQRTATTLSFDARAEERYSTTSFFKRATQWVDVSVSVDTETNTLSMVGPTFEYEVVLDPVRVAGIHRTYLGN